MPQIEDDATPIGKRVVEEHRKICPLPLMNFRPSALYAGAGAEKEMAVPALPCLGPQCILYSEGQQMTDRGPIRMPVCGLSANYALSSIIGPQIAQLGVTLAEALVKTLAQREKEIAQVVAETVADAMAEFFEETEPDDEPEKTETPETEVKPIGLHALLPPKPAE